MKAELSSRVAVVTGASGGHRRGDSLRARRGQRRRPRGRAAARGARGAWGAAISAGAHRGRGDHCAGGSGPAVPRQHARPYRLTQALLLGLRANEGEVAFVNSSVYPAARAGTSQYAATKYGLAAVADAVRDELNTEGVRVLRVLPGRTATPLQARLHEAEGRPYHPERLLQPEDVAAAVLSALELPRTAEVTDLRIRPFLKS